jgi:hypothetical protein
LTAAAAAIDPTLPGTVLGGVNYIGAMDERPRYFAQDHSRDKLVLDPRTVPIINARRLADPPSLDREGFALVRHRTAVSNFRDPEEVKRVHNPEIAALIRELTGADKAVVSGAGVLRFGERSKDAGTLLNSWPARFVHIDTSNATARAFAARALPGGEAELAGYRRYAHYNVWRALSPPPQDVPLAICDARSVAAEDLVAADAVFDAPGVPEWQFEGLVIRHNTRHRWLYFADMDIGDALVFKTKDSDPEQPHHCPHSAFDDPSCPPGVPPRASVEMRVAAFFAE